MHQIRKAIVALDYPKSELDMIRKELEPAEVVCCNAADAETVKKHLQDAEIALIGRPVRNAGLFIGPELRWLHGDLVGLESMYTPELANNKRLIVTNSSGRSSRALAEHVFLFMLTLIYRFNEIYEARRIKQWNMPFLKDARALSGRTVGILGVGSIGRELAKRCKAFGMETLGYGRSKRTDMPDFDEIFCGEELLNEVIRRSDFLVVALPLTDETYHLIGEEKLAFMKSSAYLINISRGSVVDESALIRCLADRRIAGAGLDTFEQEPLDENSPIWRMDNVVMTPHVTPQQPDKQSYSVGLILENIKAYKNGEALKNQYKPYYGFSGKS